MQPKHPNTPGQNLPQVPPDHLLPASGNVFSRLGHQVQALGKDAKDLALLRVAAKKLDLQLEVESKKRLIGVLVVAAVLMALAGLFALVFLSLLIGAALYGVIGVWAWPVGFLGTVLLLAAAGAIFYANRKKWSHVEEDEVKADVDTERLRPAA